MPLLYGLSTEKQVAQKACGVFCRVSTIRASVSFNRTFTDLFAERHVDVFLSLASPGVSKWD